MIPPSGGTGDLHDQVIRQNCRTLKTPAIAAQYQGLAEAAAREGHSHIRYLDALLGAEIEKRERKPVLQPVSCPPRRPCRSRSSPATRPSPHSASSLPPARLPVPALQG